MKSSFQVHIAKLAITKFGGFWLEKCGNPENDCLDAEHGIIFRGISSNLMVHLTLTLDRNLKISRTKYI